MTNERQIVETHRDPGVVKTEVVRWYVCGHCGRHTNSPEELPVGIGWHEHQGGGYSCPGIGTTPVLTLKTL